MPSSLARFFLFLSSYFPLSLILFVLLIKTHWQAAVILLAIGLVSLTVLLLYLWSLRNTAPMRVMVAAVQRRDRDVMAYLTGYVIPFLAVPFNGWDRGIGLALFFGVIGVLYIKSNLIHVNPMLAILGYRLYEITLQDGGVHALITKQRVVRQEALWVAKVGDDILITH